MAGTLGSNASVQSTDIGPLKRSAAYFISYRRVLLTQLLRGVSPACFGNWRVCPETVLFAHTVGLLQVGQAHNPTSTPRLDGLEVYARPKADLVKEAAAASEGEAGAAVAGTLASSNLATAAISLPGHLAAPKSAETCAVYVLSQGLLTLTSLQRCLQGQSRHLSCSASV